MNPVARTPFREMPYIRAAGRFAGSEDCPWHSHGGHEVVLVTEGNCQTRVGAQCFTGSIGTLFILPCGLRQYQENYGFTRTCYVIFTLSDAVFDTRPRAVQITPGRRCIRWLEDICDIHTSSSTLAPLVIEALLLAFLKDVEAQEAESKMAGTLHTVLGLALSFMEARLNAPLPIPELASQTHCSASHLRDLFHQEWGIGPHVYHLRLRIERAARLLKNPYLSVAEVGLACGFSDANYFTRQFVRHYEVPPTVYRRRNAGGSVIP